MGSVFFHAPGPRPPGTIRPLLSWIRQPAFCGVMIAHANDDYILMTAYLHPEQETARDSRRYWERTLPRAPGSTEVTIRSTGTWTMTSQTARAFRRGRLLLAGDAAHRFPHTGGFGLNSGMQDTHNLAWKIAAVLRGGAEDALLDTYEPERRPVVERFAEQSVANHFPLDEVTAPVGITNRTVRQTTEALALPPHHPSRHPPPPRLRPARGHPRPVHDLLPHDGLALVTPGPGAWEHALRERPGREPAPCARRQPGRRVPCRRADARRAVRGRPERRGTGAAGRPRRLAHHRHGRAGNTGAEPVPARPLAAVLEVGSGRCPPAGSRLRHASREEPEYRSRLRVSPARSDGADPGITRLRPRSGAP